MPVSPAPPRSTTPAPPGGELRAEKGINFPDPALPVSALTEKDTTDLAPVVDMVACYCLECSEDVELVVDYLHRRSAGHLPEVGRTLHETVTQRRFRRASLCD